MNTTLKDTRGCLNFVLKRTSRIVARRYDDALRPFALRITQFNVLAVLAQTGAMSLTDLAGVLAMERSALARNLKPLEQQGYVVVKPGLDRRTRVADLAARGRRKLKQALPAWGKAQDEITNSIGTSEAARLTKIVSKVGKHLEQRR